jgi:hypothetical protein|tara:strand:- start:243 stop:473 length:231 start_codon:yes stop_codon:yes gene_type:complete
MSDHTTEVATAVAAKAASVATYGGAGSAIFFGLTANEFGALCGVAIGFIGLVANIWFKHQHLKLAREQNGNSEENS